MQHRFLLKDDDTYLVDVYTVESGESRGKPLSPDVAQNYLTRMIRLVAAKFKPTGSDSTRHFFTCLESGCNTESDRWLRGIKRNLNRVLFENAKEAGDSMDKSATPLYLKHMEMINAALAKHNTAEVRSHAMSARCPTPCRACNLEVGRAKH